MDYSLLLAIEQVSMIKSVISVIEDQDLVVTTLLKQLTGGFGGL